MVSEPKPVVAWAQNLLENMMVSELQSVVAWLQVLAEHSMEFRIKVIIKSTLVFIRKTGRTQRS